tara:strand:+ start:6805 stop:7059 length:255 start_codon:yes stop_codon:yes gene_type:complete
MNIAISGFSESPEVKKILKNNFIISEVIDDNVKFLLTKKNVDDIQYKSSKIKHAITKNLPILCFEDLKKEDLINELKMMSDKIV